MEDGCVTRQDHPRHRPSLSRDSFGQRSRGKVLFNGIIRPSTMLIPFATRSLLWRNTDWLVTSHDLTLMIPTRHRISPIDRIVSVECERAVSVDPWRSRLVDHTRKSIRFFGRCISRCTWHEKRGREDTASS